MRLRVQARIYLCRSMLRASSLRIHFTRPGIKSLSLDWTAVAEHAEEPSKSVVVMMELCQAEINYFLEFFLQYNVFLFFI